MPDITMCHGDNCPQKESCYRYMAIPNDLWQSYFVEAPVKEDGKCDHYWEMDKTFKRKSLWTDVVNSEVDKKKKK